MFRLRIRHHAPALRQGVRPQQIDQRGVVVAGERDVARRAVGVETVLVDDGDGAGEGIKRVQGVVARAEQALLLQRREQEQDAAPRRLRQGAVGPRDGQQPADGGGVVARPVEDRVARAPGIATEMVPVRVIDDQFVPQ